MENLKNELLEAQVGKVLENEPLANHTTMKIGGPADLLIVPKDIDSVKTIMDQIKHHADWTVIGRGSNLLVLDKGIRGVVLKLGAGLDHLTVNDEEITVGGGYSVVRLATSLSKQGLSGLEFAAGIPGSIGGAVYMNAGAHGSDISKILVKARILFEDGSIEWLTNEQMNFSYRTSVLQRNDQALFSRPCLSSNRMIARKSQRKCSKIKTIARKHSLIIDHVPEVFFEIHCLNMQDSL